MSEIDWTDTERARKLARETRGRVANAKPPRFASRAWRKVLDKTAMAGLMENMEFLAEAVEELCDRVDALEEDIAERDGQK